jgi:hypothetical protein
VTRALANLPRTGPWTEAEAQGCADADAMRAMAVDPLPPPPPWLVRRNGVTEAAKVLFGILAAGPLTSSQVFSRFYVTDEAWSRYLGELQAAGLVIAAGDWLLARRAA